MFNFCEHTLYVVLLLLSSVIFVVSDDKRNNPSIGKHVLLKIILLIAAIGIFTDQIVEDVHISDHPTEDSAVQPPKANSTRTRERVTIVTSCSEHYFKRLRNFIGSIHYWEPKLQVH